MALAVNISPFDLDMNGSTANKIYESALKNRMADSFVSLSLFVVFLYFVSLASEIDLVLMNS